MNDKKIMVVMPAYRAARTLETAWRANPHKVERGSAGQRHQRRRDRRSGRSTGHPGDAAPDYQYEPRLVTAMAGMISSGVYDMAIGSRILGKGALKGGMPLWKCTANLVLLDLLLGWGLMVWVAQVATTILLTFTNFVAYRFGVFRS